MEYLPPHPPSAKELVEFLNKPELNKYSKLADKAAVEKAKVNLEAHGIKVTIVPSKEEALKTLKETVAKGSSVYHTASTTLWEIGWEEYPHSLYMRAGEHGLVDINSKVRAENDQVKRNTIRQKESPVADFVLCSVDAVTEDGQLLLVDSSGTKTGPFATGGKAVVVAGTHKVVASLEAAHERVESYTAPVEKARLTKLYGDFIPATWSYTTSFTFRNDLFGQQRVHVILVEEALGH